MKYKWIGIGIIAIITIIAIGGKFYTNKEEKKNEVEQIEQAQKDLSLYIVQHYKDVKKIAFEEVIYDDMTGSWTFSAVINEGNDISFSSFDLNKITNDLTIVINPKKFNLNEEIKENKTISDVDLIFSEVK